MALMNLVLYPDAPLKDTAEPFVESELGAETRQLARDMLETMYAHDGVGLAGPQVGLSKRIFVMHEPDGEPMALVNPEIYERDGTMTGDEGCLSLPDLYAPVQRASRIRVRALDPAGKPLDFEATGLLARIVQHENDHLDGVCFVERLDILTQQDKLREWDEIRQRILSAT